MRSRSRSRSAVLGASIFSVIALAGALVLVAAHYYRPPPPPFDYGERAQLVDALKGKLGASPCDLSTAVELADTMFAAGDSRGVLSMADDFTKRCGRENRLLWITYEAHKRVGEWDLAIADANVLIAAEPSDKDFRWWRGICFEHQGKLELAAADYEKAIELEPRLTNIPVNLADVYERMKRPCDAARTLRRFVEVYPDNGAHFAPRIDSLDARCHPAVKL